MPESDDDTDSLMQEHTLKDIAEHVRGRAVGDPTIVVRAVATLESAGPHDLSFLVNRKYERYLETTKAGGVIVGPTVEAAPVPLIVTEDPYYAFMQALVLLHGHRVHKHMGVSAKALIAENARIGDGCDIHDGATVADGAAVGHRCILYPGVFVGPNVHLGNDCVLYPNVTIYESCRLGSRVIIHANSTIGVDGFGYATHEGRHHKIPQIGRVLIEDDVEIGSSCAIERGTLDDTVIGEGSKLGDMIAIGHGTKLGSHCLLVAQIGIAGSTTLGHHCTVGGQVGVVGHIKIGNNVTIGAQAGVVNNVPDGETVMGAPAIDAGQARRAYTMLQYLPDLRQDVRNLQSRLRRITAALKLRPDAKDLSDRDEQISS